MSTSAVKEWVESSAYGALLMLPSLTEHPREIKLFVENESGELRDESGAVFYAECFPDLQKVNLVTSQTDHRTWVREAVDQIQKGLLNKVVVSRYLEKEYPASLSKFQLIQDISLRYTSACVFYIRHQDFGEWIGATPELLLSGSVGKYKTMALAGTQKLRTGVVPEWNMKLREEQQLVTDFILQQLAESNAWNIQIDGPHDHIAGPLVHLRSNICFESKNGIHQLAAKLHPTSAVCGVPRERAIEFIQQHESHQRGLYTGYFGFSTDEDSGEFYVALRCMQIKSNQCGIYVGGGITSASDPEEEWIETENKSRVMLDLIS